VSRLSLTYQNASYIGPIWQTLVKLYIQKIFIQLLPFFGVHDLYLTILQKVP